MPKVATRQSKKKEDNDENAAKKRKAAPTKAPTTNKVPGESSVLLNQQQKFQLLIDIEKHQGCFWKDLLKRHPTVYDIGPTHKTAFRNRFNYLVDLKKKEPQKYWTLYSKAEGKIQGYLSGKADNVDKVDEDSEEESDEIEDEDDIEEEESVASTAVSSLTASTRTKTKTKAYNNKKMAPSTASGSAKKSKKSSASTASAGFSSPTVSVSAKHNVRFDSLAKAVVFADEVVHVDYDFPEKNGGPLFWVQSVAGCKNGVKKELFTKLIIRLTTLDLSDAHEMKGTNICGGKAFLLRMPWVPNYLLAYYKHMFEMEVNKCNRTKEKHTTSAIAIIKSEDPSNNFEPRRWKHVLFVYPDGVVCTTDLTSDNPPIADEDLGFSLRMMKVDKTEVGSGDQKDTVPQVFAHGFFALRIIDDDAENWLEIGEKKKEGTSLKDLFAGMTILGEKGENDLMVDDDDSEESSSGKKPSSDSEEEDEVDDEW